MAAEDRQYRSYSLEALRRQIVAMGRKKRLFLVDNNFYGTTNQGYSNQAAQPSPDSVAEFRMSVNAYSAEYVVY